MNLFNLCLVVVPATLILYSIKRGGSTSSREATATGRPELYGKPIALALFVVLWFALMIRHQVNDPTWTPHGPDWDRWYQSALAVGSDIPYPPHRWPLWGWIVNTFDAISPRPLYVNVQLVTLGGCAALLTGVFWLSWRLMGSVGAIAATVLAAFSPMVLQTADWCSAYSLWAALVTWCIVAMVEFARSGTRLWAVACGATWAGMLAIMPKGLGIGLLFLPVLGLALVTRRKDGLRTIGRHLALFSTPVLLLAISYAKFPTPLMTLDARVTSADVPVTASDPGSVNAALFLSEFVEVDLQEKVVMQENYAPETYTSNGYVFGQNSSISTIFNTLRTAGESTSSQDRMRGDSWANFTSALPSLNIWLSLILMGGMLGVSIYSLRVRAWHEAIGWTSVMLVVLGVGLTVLRPHFQLRFLTPAMPLLGILAVAPIALLARRSSNLVLRLTPLALVPLAFISPSPWTDNDTVDSWVEALDVRGGTALHLINSMEQIGDVGPIDAMAPANIAIPVLGEFGGRFLTPDPRFYPMTKPVELDPESFVLFVRDPLLLERLDGVDPFGPQELTNFYGRREISTWSGDGGMTIVLSGPVEAATR